MGPDEPLLRRRGPCYGHRILLAVALHAVLIASATPAKPTVMPMDRVWQVLTATTSPHRQLRQAAEQLGAGRFNLAGQWIDRAALLAVAESPPAEPLTRTIRETFERPVDMQDFLLFVDDLLRSGRDLVRAPAYLPAGRARAIGVLLHPNDVFRPDKPRRYAETATVVGLELPTAQVGLKPPPDGAVVGPRWAARYQQPQSEAGRMAALKKVNPDMAARVASLMTQLKAQGAMVYVESTVRRRERGYLLYGSFILSRSTSEKQVAKNITRLDAYNAAWGLNVPIKWAHPGGWRATIDAARALAETYGVVYATRRGAKSSDHYDGSAVDLFVVNLPRKLRLRGPDGATIDADLSAPNESRDLSLTPRLIEWIEAHFQFEKLRRDYPHWTDTKTPRGG